jgi:hypothetical protein
VGSRKLIQLNLSSLQDGLYFIKYEDETTNWTEKIIIKK